MSKDLTKILCAAQLSLAKCLKEKLDDRSITPQEMNVLRQLLKDNHIEANPTVQDHPLKKAAQALPTISDEDIQFFSN